MRIVRGLESYPPEADPSVVVLGAFDGIHLGHRAILGTAVAQARLSGLQALACTFDPHPLEVLQPERSPVPITTLEERLELIAETGIDTTVVVPPMTVDGVPVSSSEIRSALQRGDLPRAARLLGRAYSIQGEVVRGAGRGRTLGFPTANVRTARPLLLPAGVYACQADVEGAHYQAVINVGVRPTFGETELAVEAHLLDFTGDLYGRRLRLTFLRRLRDERKFSSVEALRSQIALDVLAARRGS